MHQTRLKKIFANVDLQDAYVLYITTDEYPIFIGYFILDETHITASPLFESYRQNMIAVGEDDPLTELRNEHCLHLRSWVFDKQLVHLGGTPPPSDNNSIFGVQQVSFFRLCFAIKDSEMLNIFQIYHAKYIRIWLLQKNC